MKVIISEVLVSFNADLIIRHMQGNVPTLELVYHWYKIHTFLRRILHEDTSHDADNGSSFTKGLAILQYR